MMNIKTKIGSMFLLAAIMVAGTISMTIPSSFAYPGADVQTIKCINSNININGVDINKRPPVLEEDAAAADAQQIQNGQRNGLFDGINLDRNLVNICVNVNLNHQLDDPFRILK